MKKYLSISNSFLKGNQKENWESVKNEYDGLSLTCNASSEEIEDNRFRVVMSTPKENRNGYEIMQNFKWTAFKKNPVLVDNHITDQGIDRILGKVENIRKNKDGNHEGDTIFALDSPRGALAYKLVKGGFLNAVSITIIPLEFDDDGKIVKSEVLELSYVLVPADEKTLVKRNKEEAEKVENCQECGEETNNKHIPDPTKIVDEDNVEKFENIYINKESRKKQILRILENKKKKDIEIKKEMLAVTNRLRNHPTVDKDDEAVKMANRLKKLTKKL